VKIKTLIAYLEEFDDDQEIVFYELSDLYDTVLLRIKEDYASNEVVFQIKNIPKENKGALH
jgi:uncharacterized protein YqgQ